MSEQKKAGGSCLCGAVGFELTLPSKWCAHCHCTMCRKEHGAGYVTWAGFEDSHYTLLRGQQDLRWFGSSPGAERGFCAVCGSSMFFKSERWAGEIHVAMGCLDDPIDRKPQAHVFHETHVDWMSLDDTLAIVNPDQS